MTLKSFSNWFASVRKSARKSPPPQAFSLNRSELTAPTPPSAVSSAHSASRQKRLRGENSGHFWKVLSRMWTKQRPDRQGAGHMEAPLSSPWTSRGQPEFEPAKNAAAPRRVTDRCTTEAKPGSFLAKNFRTLNQTTGRARRRLTRSLLARLGLNRGSRRSPRMGEW